MSREGVRVEKKRVERSASRELSIERVEECRERERVGIQRQRRERESRVETDVERETE